MTLIIFWVLPLPVFAMRVPGLYTAEVPVPDQSEKNRDEAVQTALRMVLVKLTGDRFAGAPVRRCAGGLATGLPGTAPILPR